MKTNRYAEWLSIIANFSVVAGIIFLAVELQQNNEIQRGEARRTYMEIRKTAMENQYQNEALLESLLKARSGGELTPLEAERLAAYYRSVFVIWEWEYEQHRNGLLDEPPQRRQKAAADNLPLFQETWQKHRSGYTAEFGNYMEENVFN